MHYFNVLSYDVALFETKDILHIIDITFLFASALNGGGGVYYLQFWANTVFTWEIGLCFQSKSSCLPLKF